MAQTFYILDLGIYEASNWDKHHVERFGRSASSVASQFAAEIDEDVSDGGRFEVAVASKKDGSDAVKYTLCCDVEVSYRLKKEEEFEVLPPDSDD